MPLKPFDPLHKCDGEDPPNEERRRRGERMMQAFFKPHPCHPRQIWSGEDFQDAISDLLHFAHSIYTKTLDGAAPQQIHPDQYHEIMHDAVYAFLKETGGHLDEDTLTEDEQWNPTDDYDDG